MDTIEEYIADMVMASVMHMQLDGIIYISNATEGLALAENITVEAIDFYRKNGTALSTQQLNKMITTAYLNFYPQTQKKQDQ